jgi:hypothetical protein
VPECSGTQRLRRLTEQDLVVGRTLPGAVRDGAGRVLIQSGETLSAEHLGRLGKRGACALYAGDDWGAPPQQTDPKPQPLRAEEVVQALQRRMRIPGTDGRIRRQQRYAWHVRLRMAILECSEGVVNRRDVEVETCDLSASGFAFLSRQFVHVGTMVYPRFTNLPKRPVLKGIVRNCTHLEGRRHRVGVEFLHLDPEEVVPEV